jgi:hypothetical protein
MMSPAMYDPSNSMVNLNPSANWLAFLSQRGAYSRR